MLVDVHLTLTSPAGPVQVLNGVDLDVARGETVSIIGPSGAGKTSMLMLIAGLESPTSGTVRVAGRDLPGLNEDQLAAFRSEHVGVVFQAFHLVPTMTALENVALPLEFAGTDTPHERALAALDAVGLADRASHYPSQLSGGEQQRVAIARAFAPRPPILLADEPTGNLDEETGTRIMDLLFSLRQDTGSTLVLVTHDRELARRSDRTLTMHAGRLGTTGGKA
ncbi:MAG: ABC transporter ATP-binding protein [Proteobacteria bacterium]|nr:ABC transporter ATP-binding protein [Pseudomonadota bacterium]